MLSSWTDKEKFQLLRSLKKHGSSNVEIVAKEIPSKSLHEVAYAITFYSDAARKSLKADNRSRHRQAPIDRWIQFVKRHTPNLRRSRDFATVLKIFAFDVQSDEINYEDLYLFLADLSLGNVPRQLDYKTNMFLLTIISEIARKCKHGTTQKQLQLVANLNKKNISKATTLKEDNDLEVDEEENSVLEFLQNNPALNPLKIKQSFLKNNRNHRQKRSRPSKLRDIAWAMKKRLI